MKKVLLLTMVVMALAGFDAVTVSAGAAGTNAVIVPLIHGVDH